MPLDDEAKKGGISEEEEEGKEKKEEKKGEEDKKEEELPKKYYVSDPERADRIFETSTGLVKLTAGEIRTEVSEQQASELTAKFPYLKIIEE